MFAMSKFNLTHFARLQSTQVMRLVMRLVVLGAMFGFAAVVHAHDSGCGSTFKYHTASGNSCENGTAFELPERQELRIGEDAAIIFPTAHGGTSFGAGIPTYSLTATVTETDPDGGTEDKTGQIDEVLPGLSFINVTGGANPRIGGTMEMLGADVMLTYTARRIRGSFNDNAAFVPDTPTNYDELTHTFSITSPTALSFLPQADLYFERNEAIPFNFSNLASRPDNPGTLSRLDTGLDENSAYDTNASYTLTGPSGESFTSSVDDVPGLRVIISGPLGVIFGTPSVRGTTEMTYKAVDAYGYEAERNFKVIIVALGFDNPITSTSFPAGVMIDPDDPAATLPPASNGGLDDDDDVITYTLWGQGGDANTANLPAGMGFDEGTQTLSGMPATAGAYPLTYTATQVPDADGGGRNQSAALTFTLNITGPVFAGDAPAPPPWAVNEAVHLTLPIATGLSPLGYALVGPGERTLAATVPGLSFTVDVDADVDPAVTTVTLAGRPTTPMAATRLTYRATDAAATPNTTPLIFTVAVAEVAFESSPADVTGAVGQAITSMFLPPLARLDSTYTALHTLATTDDNTESVKAATGLDYDTASRMLSGTLTQAGAVTLVYTATDSHDNTAQAEFTVTGDALALAFDQGEVDFEHLRAITPLTLPELLGVSADYSADYTLRDADDALLSSAVPGLSFDALTRTVSGIPTSVGVDSMTYTATDQYGNAVSDIFNVQVNPAFTVSLADQTYAAGVAISPVTIPRLPADISGNATTLRRDGGSVLNAGDSLRGLAITLSGSNVVISGTPSTAGRTTLRYSQFTDGNTNTRIEVSDTFVLAVTGPRMNDAEAEGLVFDPNEGVGTILFLRNNEITPLTFPSAVSSAPGDLIYTLVPRDNNNLLPMGLEYTAGTRVLSGTPTARGLARLDYQITDSLGNVATDASGAIEPRNSVIIRVTEITFEDSMLADSYPVGIAIDITLPAASSPISGVTIVSYNIGSGVLSELNFTNAPSDPISLSGTPTQAGSFVLTYSAQASNGDQSFIEVPIVIEGPMFGGTRSSNVRWRIGESIGNTLPRIEHPLGFALAPDGYHDIRDGNNTSTGPVYTLTGPNGQALAEAVPGITLVQPDVDSGRRGIFIIGSPSTPDIDTTLTYTATDHFGNSIADTFTVVTEALRFQSPPVTQAYTAGVAIDALNLPRLAGVDNNVRVDYTLTGADGVALSSVLPGLTFDSDSRNLSGTPRQGSSPTTLTYTATDRDSQPIVAVEDFAVTTMFAVEVTGPAFQSGVAEQLYLVGAPVNLTLPAISGDYHTLTLTGPNGAEVNSVLPGLSFQANPPALVGTPTAIGGASLTFTAAAADGTSTLDFAVQVYTPLALAEVPIQPAYQVGDEVNFALPEATDGFGERIYTLTGADGVAVAEVAPGLRFDAANRALVGSPTEIFTNISLTYGVQDDTAVATVMFVVTATNGDAPTIALVGAADLATELGDAFVDPGVTITDTEDEADGIDIAPTVVITNNASGEIVGGVQINALGAAYTITYTYTDGDGNRVTITRQVTVTDTTPPTLIADSAASNVVITGGATATLAYRATDNDSAVAADLLRTCTTAAVTDPDTGVVSELDTTASVVLTCLFADPSDNVASIAETIVVLPIDGIDDQSYVAGTAVDIALPAADSGESAPDLIYSLSGPGTQTLNRAVPGLSFDAAADRRRLSGTPLSGLSSRRLTYQVAKGDDSAMIDFAVEVSGPSFSDAAQDRTYPVNQTTNQQLASASGSSGTIALRLTTANGGPLPAGFSFVSGSRELTGFSSVTLPPTALTYTATAGDGVASQTFTVQINEPLALITPPTLTYAPSLLFTTTLPAVTGGIGRITSRVFRANGLNVNTGVEFSFNEDNRVLTSQSGFRAEAGEVISRQLTYEVSDTVLRAANPATSIRVPFTIDISGPLFAAVALPPQSYPRNAQIPPLTLPASTAEVVNATATYTLRGPNATADDDDLPFGLTFDTNEGILSGTPAVATGADGVVLIYLATDEHGNKSREANFTLTITRGFDSAIGDVSFNPGDPVSLTLPASSGAGEQVYSLVGPDSTAADPKLPAGLSFDPAFDSRVLSGTATATAVTRLTYTAARMDDASDVITAMFDFTVTGPSFNLGQAGDFPLPMDDSYPVDVAIDAITMPTATVTAVTLVSGDTTPTYTLTGSSGVPPGLSFAAAADMRILSGTPAESAVGVYPLTYAAADRFGNQAEHIFTINITNLAFDGDLGDDNPALMASVGDEIGNEAGDDVTISALPMATGGTGAISYALFGAGNVRTNNANLPADLSFNGAEDSRLLSGTAQTAGTFRLTYEASTDDGGLAVTNFMLIIDGGPAFIGDLPLDASYPVGLAITAPPLPMASGFENDLTYTLTGADLPEWITFHAEADPAAVPPIIARTMVGVPDALAEAVALTYTAADQFGNAVDTTFLVTITGPLFAGAFPLTDESYPAGIAITAVTLPTARGAGVTHTLVGQDGDAANPNLPAGLVFGADNLTWSGTPSAVAASAMLTYTATDRFDNSTAEMFTVTVTGPTFASAAPEAQVYTAERAIEALLLSAASTTGMGDVTYTLTGPNPTTGADGDHDLPGGLTFNAEADSSATPAIAARTLTGTPSAETAAAMLTYTATDGDGGLARQMFSVRVAATISVPELAAEYTFAAESAANQALPPASGGVGTLAYALFAGADPNTPNLPAGLNFNVGGNRIIGGSPSLAGTTTLTYRITDDATPSANMVDQVFEAVVTRAFDGSLASLNNLSNQTYRAGDTISAIPFPTATGGDSTLGYALFGPGDDRTNNANLPDGLSFDAGNRMLVATDTRRQTPLPLTLLTYAAIDSADTVDSATSIEVELNFVINGPEFNAGDDDPALPGTQNYQGDMAIEALPFPTAAGNGGGYTLTGNGADSDNDGLPTGLTFNQTADAAAVPPIAARTLTGVPTADGRYRLTYTYTDDFGNAISHEFDVFVSSLIFAADPGAQSGSVGVALNIPALPVATLGGNSDAVVTYALYGPGTIADPDNLAAANNSNLPDGLSFANAATARMLSGTPELVGEALLTYAAAATDADVTSMASATFMFTVGGGPVFADGYSIENVSYVTGIPITDMLLDAADGFETTDMPLTYTLLGNGGTADSPNLPAGLAFGGANATGTAARTLSGTPTGAPAAAVDLTYTATDEFGNVSDEVMFAVTITGPVFDGENDLPIVAEIYPSGIAITAKTLPSAHGAGISYALTGANGGNLPDGLVFGGDNATGAAARTLSGTPTTAADAVEFTYTATDSTGNANVTTANFTVTITGPTFDDAAPAAQVYTAGKLIAALPLSAATTNGATPLAYTLYGPNPAAANGGLPAGLTFNAEADSSATPAIAARTLTGTPEAVTASATVMLTYTATDAATGTAPNIIPGGFSDQTFAVTINPGLAFPANSNPDRTYSAGVNLADLAADMRTLTAATGGTGSISYALFADESDPATLGLPATLGFNATTQTLTGMATAAGTTTMTYRATDAATPANITNAVFTITITGPTFGNQTIAAQIYTAGTAIPDLPLPTADSSADPLTYTLTGANPTRDTDGDITDADLPAGLVFNTAGATPTLGGNPSATTADLAGGVVTLTYIATDNHGNATPQVTFSVTINRAFSATIGDQSFTVGADVAGEIALPTASGGGTLVYSLVGPNGTDSDRQLPAGLIYTAGTPPVLSGTLETVAEAVTLVYSATNSANSADFIEQTFDFAVEQIAFADEPPTTINYPVDVLIDAAAATVLPAVTRGTNVVYTLLPEAGNTFPPGLTFNPIAVDAAGGNPAIAARTITGTPDMTGSFPLLYTATAGPGSFGGPITRNITVSVSSLTYAADPGAQIGSVGVALNIPALPVARLGNNATAVITYALYGPGTIADPADLAAANNSNLPDDLSFDNDAGERILSGTPELVGETLLTYAAVTTNAGVASSVSATFTLTVSGGPAFAANVDIVDKSYVTGININTGPSTNLLPAAASGFGGVDSLTYTLLGNGGTADSPNLPAGLAFGGVNATGDAARTLSGTPTGVPSATAVDLAYTATDRFGNVSDEVMFAVTITGPVFAADPTAQIFTSGNAITPIVLPSARGAGISYALTGAGGGNLPDGLVFNAGNAAIGTDAARTLSGTPTTAADAVTLVYTATDSTDDANATTANFTVTITGPTFADAAPGAQMYTAGLPITAETLSEASTTTAAASVVYTLTGANPVAANNGLPAGLTFNATANSDTGAAARTLTGTPQAVDASTTVTLTYTATDANGDGDGVRIGGFAQQFFDVTINPGLAFPANSNPDRIYAAGVNLADLAADMRTLTAATGGTGTISYALFAEGGSPTDARLPAGLNFNTAADSRAISGTPTAAASTEMTYRATDAATPPTSTNAVFTITITGPIFAADALADALPGEAGEAVTFPVGEAITDLVLPAASSSAAPVTYTLTGADLPAGLEFDAAVDVRTLSGTPTVAANAVTLTYKAIDNYGNQTPAGTFELTIDQVLDGEVVEMFDRVFPIGIAVDITLPPVRSDGYVYTLTSAAFPPGLAFNARTLTGQPTTSGSYLLTYTATPPAGGAATVALSYEFTFAVVDMAFVETEQTYNFAVDDVVDMTLPEVVGGFRPVTYALTAGGVVVDGSLAAEIAADLSFDPDTRVLTGTLDSAIPDLSLLYTATDSASNPGPNTATANITIRVSGGDVLDAVNQIILPEVVRAISDSVTTAITARIDQVKSGGAPGLAFGGQNSIAGVLATHGQSMAQEEREAKTLLAGTRFNLPLNAGTDSGGGAIARSAALWGSGEYREISGESGALGWDGELRGFHIGIDARLRPDLVAGLSAAKMRSAIDYRDLGGGLGAGAHDIDLTSLHPYLGWRAGEVDVWATLGYGGGKVEITPLGEATISGDLSMRALGVGGSSEFWHGAPFTMRFKSEAAYSELEVDGNADLAAMTTAATRLRLSVEASERFALRSGGEVTPRFDAGVRYAGGDGETGAAGEVSLGLRYASATSRFAADGRLHLVTSPGDYEEWGFQGTVTLQPGADGQGLSLSLTPAYGAAAAGIEQIWSHGLATAATATAAAEHNARMNVRLGYGVSLSSGSVLTPYGEIILDATDSHRLGMNWKTPNKFDLNLLGERRPGTTTTDPEHSILMRGEIQF